MDLFLVHKIYQRPALVNAEPPQPAGGGNAQLIHDGGRPDPADAGQGLEHLGNLHAREGGVTVAGTDEISHGERPRFQLFLGLGPGSPCRGGLAQGVRAFLFRQGP